MREIIFMAPDSEFLAFEASRLGFMDNDGHIVTNGGFDSGGGWFLNIVGDVYDDKNKRAGYWGRLRINGAPEQMPSFSDQIVQYGWNATLGGWTSDGVTLAPDWIASVGMIA